MAVIVSQVSSSSIVFSLWRQWSKVKIWVKCHRNFTSRSGKIYFSLAVKNKSCVTPSVRFLLLVCNAFVLTIPIHLGFCCLCNAFVLTITIHLGSDGMDVDKKSRDPKTLRDENGHYPVWMNSRRVKKHKKRLQGMAKKKDNKQKSKKKRWLKKQSIVNLWSIQRC